MQAIIEAQIEFKEREETACLFEFEQIFEDDARRRLKSKSAFPSEVSSVCLFAKSTKINRAHLFVGLSKKIVFPPNNYRWSNNSRISKRVSMLVFHLHDLEANLGLKHIASNSSWLLFSSTSSSSSFYRTEVKQYELYSVNHLFRLFNNIAEVLFREKRS